MNSNTIRDIRQFLAGGVDEKVASSQTEWITRKITTRFLLEQAVYISGASEYVCFFRPDTLRADDYDEVFLGSGVRMFDSRKDYEDAKKRECWKDYENIPYFYVVDGKILGPVCNDREEKEHSVEEALSLIFPELPKKLLLYASSSKSDGFALDLTKTCEELSEKLADEAHERFGGDIEWYRSMCLPLIANLKRWICDGEDLRKKGKFSVGHPYFSNAYRRVFYWEVVE
jgi:hypothetical protein